MKYRIFTLLLVFVVQLSIAQTMEVSGVVTSSEDGQPISDVSVVVVSSDTGVGVLTDFDGKYVIEVDKGNYLRFSFLGYRDKIIVVSENIASVVLDLESLEEVIVVGYGTSTKEAFTGSAVQVNSEDLSAKNTANVSQALAGEVAGVTVINTSGQPGTSSTIRIRGFGSINGNRDPLYVVDGVPLNSSIDATDSKDSGDSINSINVADIESMTVLKDASATAIYGSRGANGVILITTKKGKAGKNKVEVNFNYGVNSRLLPRYDRTTNQEEYLELTWESIRNNRMINQKLDFNKPDDVSASNKWASDNIFGDKGIAKYYNMWNKPGNELIDPETGKFKSNVNRSYTPEKWEDVLFKTPQRLEGNIRMSGGVGKTTYSTSFGVLSDKGYYFKSDYERYTSRLGIGHQVKKWLKGTMNIGYTYSGTNNPGQTTDSGSGFWFADNIPAIYPVYLREKIGASGYNTGKIIPDEVLGGNKFDYAENTKEFGNKRGFAPLTNAVGGLTYDERFRRRHEVNGNAYLEAEFLKYFKVFTRFGLQYSRASLGGLRNPFYGSAVSQGGSIYRVGNEVFTQNFLQGASYTRSFDQHSVNISLFHETNKYDYYRDTTRKSNLVDPFGFENNNAVVMEVINSYDIKRRIESFFGKASYNFEKRYYADVTVRSDGSSRFKNNKWGTFYSGGVGWIISKESFMASVDIIKYLKFKASYGITGDQKGASFYSGYDLFEITNLNKSPSLSFKTKGNPDLTWESSKMFQVGITTDLGSFLSVEMDYYIKNTTNLFFNRRVGPSLGYALLKVNDGILKNSGFEFSLKAHVLNKNGIKLDLTLNGEILKNELMKMPIDPAINKEKILDISSIYGRSKNHSLYDFYIREFKGVDPKDGTSRWTVKYDDKNSNGKLDKKEGITSLHEYLIKNPKAKILETTTGTYSSATQMYVGKSAIPNIRGAFRISSSYKRFDVSLQFLYQFGGYSMDYVYSGLMGDASPGEHIWHTDIRKRWKKPGDKTDVPRISAGSDTATSSTSTRFLVSSDYISFNNFRVGYKFSKKIAKRIRAQSLSIFLTGNNLWLYSSREGFNPSTSETGVSSVYRYAPLTTFSGGVKLSF